MKAEGVFNRGHHVFHGQKRPDIVFRKPKKIFPDGHTSSAITSKAPAIAFFVLSIWGFPWTAETNAASYWEGGK